MPPATALRGGAPLLLLPRAVLQGGGGGVPLPNADVTFVEAVGQDPTPCETDPTFQIANTRLRARTRTRGAEAEGSALFT